MALVVLLIVVSVARLLVTMHQQEERISILEAQVDELLSDTTRLQLPAYAGYTSRNYDRKDRRPYGRNHSYDRRTYAHTYHHSSSQQSDPVYADSASEVLTPSRIQAEHTTETDRPRKYTEPHLFDLNTIDSLTLIRIPGIAARTASVILQQRQKYGGFYDANQLRDFLTWEAARDYLDEWCSLWFSANADRLVRIPINKATISQLQRHPYLTHEQAVEIFQFRTRHKGFYQASELQQLTSFAPEEITRLLPYLSFEK